MRFYPILQIAQKDFLCYQKEKEKNNMENFLFFFFLISCRCPASKQMYHGSWQTGQVPTRGASYIHGFQNHQDPFGHFTV